MPHRKSRFHRFHAEQLRKLAEQPENVGFVSSLLVMSAEDHEEEALRLEHEASTVRQPLPPQN